MYLKTYSKGQLTLFSDFRKINCIEYRTSLALTSNLISPYRYSRNKFEQLYYASDFAGFSSVPRWTIHITIGDKVYFRGEWYSIESVGDVKYLTNLIQMKMSMKKAGLEESESDKWVLYKAECIIGQQEYLRI